MAKKQRMANKMKEKKTKEEEEEKKEKRGPLTIEMFAIHCVDERESCFRRHRTLNIRNWKQINRFQTEDVRGCWL